MLEDLRANSWSLRPCCMVLAYRAAHFCSVWRKKNVLNNLWAAPLGAEGAWIELTWPRPQKISLVQLTFDTGLHRSLTLTAQDSYHERMVRGPGGPKDDDGRETDLFA